MAVIRARVASVLCEETLQTAQFVADLAFLKERTFCVPSHGFAQSEMSFFSTKSSVLFIVSSKSICL